MRKLMEKNIAHHTHLGLDGAPRRPWAHLQHLGLCGGCVFVRGGNVSSVLLSASAEALASRDLFSNVKLDGLSLSNNTGRSFYTLFVGGLDCVAMSSCLSPPFLPIASRPHFSSLSKNALSWELPPT